MNFDFRISRVDCIFCIMKTDRIRGAAKNRDDTVIL